MSCNKDTASSTWCMWVDNIELDVKSSLRVDNMYSMWFRIVSSAGIF
jgi:hypothetical protein